MSSSLMLNVPLSAGPVMEMMTGIAVGQVGESRALPDLELDARGRRRAADPV